MSTKTKTHNVPRSLSRKNQNDSKTEDKNTTRNTKKSFEKYKDEFLRQKQDSNGAKTTTASVSLQSVKKLTKETGSSRKPMKATSKTKVEKISSPPSKRVTRTQFFSAKNNYSEVLHQLNKYEELNNEVPRRTGLISNEIKDIQINPKDEKSTENQSKDFDLSESSSVSERPRTSTLRRGSIVNHNIAGPECPKNIKTIPREPEYNEEKKISIEEEVVEYEDDFESYESDFENCSSSDSTIHDISDISTEKISSSSSAASENNEEQSSHMDKCFEKKLDSGNFDLDENKVKQEFANNQEIIDHNITNIHMKTIEKNFKSNLTSLSDEGFEESKSLQFLNFAEARKKHDLRKCREKRKKRGEELLNMIKLDHVNFIIFDLLPVSYENYIRHFGNLTSIQEGVQTDEDNVDDQMQTDTIEMCSKWVQMPPHISNLKSCYYKYELKGVGPDMDRISEENVENIIPSFNERKLKIFLTASVELILNILKERKPPIHRIKENSKNILSNGFVQFDSPPQLLLDKKNISYVSFNARNPSMFLSVHVDEANEENSRSIVCLWNVNDDLPKLKMTCYGKITSCCFGPDSDIVVAGLENGSLVLWEIGLWTNCDMFQFIERDMRTPTFMTQIEIGHFCKVIAIQLVFENNIHNSFHIEKQPSQAKQLCSLDYEGDIIIWSLITKPHLNVGENRGTTMENIILYKSFSISLRGLLPEMKDLICTDIILPKLESGSAFVGTNYGIIVHCFLNKQKTYIKQLTSGDSSAVECLCNCPFSHMYFLAAFKNGNISLYSRKTYRPLMVISNEKYKKINAYCVEVQWSFEKPCMFYTRSSENTIDVWDLSQSNILPVKSMAFDDNITSMELSPSSITRRDNVYLMISTKTKIYMHFLSADQIRKNAEAQREEVKTFINYGNRL